LVERPAFTGLSASHEVQITCIGACIFMFLGMSRIALCWQTFHVDGRWLLVAEDWAKALKRRRDSLSNYTDDRFALLAG
jgi:hypothetical protein